MSRRVVVPQSEIETSPKRKPPLTPPRTLLLDPLRHARPPNGPVRYAPERWQSGRMHRTRNAAYSQGYRGFESLPLRQPFRPDKAFRGAESASPLFCPLLRRPLAADEGGCGRSRRRALALERSKKSGRRLSRKPQPRSVHPAPGLPMTPALVTLKPLRVQSAKVPSGPCHRMSSRPSPL